MSSWREEERGYNARKESRWADRYAGGYHYQEGFERAEREERERHRQEMEAEEASRRAEAHRHDLAMQAQREYEEQHQEPEPSPEELQAAITQATQEAQNDKHGA